MPPSADLHQLRSEIALAADQCVMCGLCLPHCPSYRVARVEGESPRGRIAYGKALAAGTMEPTSAMLVNLDDCLACGVCEAVCPSQVRYMDIAVATRALLQTPKTEPRSRRRMRALARRPRLWRALQSLARPAAALGLMRALATVAPSWRTLLDQWRGLPASAAPPPAFTPARGTRRGSLAVFRGCAAAALDADTHAACVSVLTRLGYDVHAPPQAMCCGALEHHAGDLDAAKAQEQHARDLLGALGVDAVIGSASGCQHALSERVQGSGGPPSYDILAFLARDPEFARTEMATVSLKAALMVPCTQLGSEAATLLARVPGLELAVLPQQPRCCGAAGLYFMDHAQIAEPLRGERLAQIQAVSPDVVFTTNIGCRLYLSAGLRKLGLTMPVRHPITLIAESMP